MTEHKDYYSGTALMIYPNSREIFQLIEAMWLPSKDS